MSILRHMRESITLPIFHKGKLLKKLRKQWQNPPHKWRDFSQIKTFFTLTSSDCNDTVIDNKTWNDLDMDSVFSRVDTSLTGIGQQYLYRKMRLLKSDSNDLAATYNEAKNLQYNQTLREELQTSIYPLVGISATIAVKLIFDKFPYLKLPKWVAAGWAVASIAALYCAVLFGEGLFSPLMFLVVIVNFFLSQKFQLATEKSAYGLYCIHKILSVSHAIAINRKLSSVPLHSAFSQDLKRILKSKRQLSVILLSQTNHNSLIGYPMYIVNLLVPVDILVYALFMGEVQGNVETIRRCFYTLGEIDTNISVASYIEHYPNHCNPQFTETREIELKNAYHPLVENYVANSFKSMSKSALVTGSNMAGKTTFIRTIGVNLILARTLWLCHSDSANIPIIALASSINNSDGLEQGKSYYFTELEYINKFLKLSENSSGHLFLIDEIFRGTNTVERIGGAAAVLQELAKNNLVLVTTHDLELENYLSERYDMWHFSETGNKEQPFDYKIRTGICKTRNALKLMEKMDYPKPIINQAKIIANDIAKIYCPPLARQRLIEKET